MTEHTPGGAAQQVLKAEGASPDATDRAIPVTTSPGVGPTGAGQPADAGPAGEPCPDCKAAAALRHHQFTAGCMGCCARAAARSPQYFAARKAGVIDHQYRRLLQQFGLTHEAVKAAAAADKASRT